MNNYVDFEYDLVSDIIESSNSIVHSDVKNSDIEFIDFLVEIIKDELPINKILGVKVLNFREIHDRNYHIPASHLNYYKSNSMSVLFVLYNEDNNDLLWEYVELPMFNLIKFTIEKEFSVSSFNLDVVPFIVSNRLTLSNLKNRIHNDNYKYLKLFLTTNFKYLDLIFPIIIKNRNFEDFLSFTKLECLIQENQDLNPVEFDKLGGNPKGINLGETTHSWWYMTEKFIFITPDQYLNIKKLYESLHN